MVSTMCTTKLGVAALALFSAVAASVLMAVVLAGPAQAATFTVTTDADEQNANARCSLREAIINANQNDQSGSADCAAGVGEDTINFDPGVSPATVTLASQLPAITDGAGLTIDGGSANITVSGGGAVRVFQVGSSGKVTLDKLTVANGKMVNDTIHDGAGGGIHNAGTLTVSNSTLSGNIASAKFSGIVNYGPATLKNTIVANSPSTGQCTETDEPLVSPITDGGHNLDSGTSCGFATSNNSLFRC